MGSGKVRRLRYVGVLWLSGKDGDVVGLAFEGLLVPLDELSGTRARLLRFRGSGTGLDLR